MLIRPGDTVVVAAFDDVLEHLFLVYEVYDDVVTGEALTGPFAGEYGEPERDRIVAVARLGSSHSV